MTYIPLKAEMTKNTESTGQLGLWLFSFLFPGHSLLATRTAVLDWAQAFCTLSTRSRSYSRVVKPCRCAWSCLYWFWASENRLLNGWLNKLLGKYSRIHIAQNNSYQTIYGIFNYTFGSFYGSMLVNIPHIVCLGLVLFQLNTTHRGSLSSTWLWPRPTESSVLLSTASRRAKRATTVWCHYLL